MRVESSCVLSLLRSLSFALHDLREQRSRAVLSALGVFVASVAIVTLVAIGIGVKKDLTDQVETLGVNTLVVLPGRVESGMMNPNIGGQSFLTEELANQVKALPGVRAVALFSFAGGGVKLGEKEAYPFVIAANAPWFAMNPASYRYGKPWTGETEAEAVCVIGSVAAEELFGLKTNPVGKSIEINGIQYKVVAVSEDKKATQSVFSMMSLQNVVYIPYHAVKKRTPSMQTDRIMVGSQLDAEPKALVSSIEGVLAKKLQRSQYSVLTQEDLLGLVFKLMGILGWLVTGLTSIALFVGGVGIMAVMVMAVTERTKEIGIRRTVGADRKAIFTQFLVESVLISLFGGLSGLAFSAVLCAMLRSFTDIKPMITWGVVALSILTCVAVGTIFGILPAARASKKDTVECLRTE